MKKRHLKKGLVVLAVCLFAVIAYAVTKTLKNANNRFYPSEADITLYENGNAVSGTNTVALTADTSGDILTADKKVEIENTSANAGQELFVRAAIYPKYENGSFDYEIYIPNEGFPESISGNTFTMGDVTFNLSDNWNDYWFYNSSDGFFYYKNVLANGETTEPLLQSVSIFYNNWLAQYEKGANLKVDVLADAIQSVGGAVESRWTVEGINSNDKERPEESDAQAAIAAFSLRDAAVSDSTVSAASIELSDYMLSRVLSMVTTVNVTTVYEYTPQEEAQEEAVENVEKAAEAEESAAENAIEGGVSPENTDAE